MKLNNQFRSWILLTFTSLLILALCNLQWGRNGLLWSFAFVFCIHSFFFFMGELKIKNHFPTEPLEGRDSWGVYEIIERLVKRNRLETPAIFVIPTDHCQSFALARNFSANEIYLTQGLLNLLSKDELEGIISLQLVNIKLKNTQAFTLMGSLAAVFLYLSYKVDLLFSWLFSKKSHDAVVNNQGGMMTWFFATFLHLLFQMVFKTKDSLEADKMAAEIIGSPESLAAALWKVESYSQTMPLKVPLHFTHYFVVNPQYGTRFQHNFEIQPSITQRINNLVGHYPL